jgi:hypothetical protein
MPAVISEKARPDDLVILSDADEYLDPAVHPVIHMVGRSNRNSGRSFKGIRQNSQFMSGGISRNRGFGGVRNYELQVRQLPESVKGHWIIKTDIARRHPPGTVSPFSLDE